MITSKFGTDLTSDSSDSEECDSEFENICDLIIGRALDSYVKSEYGNLWETHQARPHAYGKNKECFRSGNVWIPKN